MTSGPSNAAAEDRGGILYATLRRFGFARGAYRATPDDGLELIDCRITNAVRCVPPANRPQSDEVAACRQFLAGELRTPPAPAVVLPLGGIAHGSVLRALGLIKQAAAAANKELGLLGAATADAIAKAALEVAEGGLDAHFPVDVFQTGSGTSSNMNANEVIAHLASRHLGRAVHANDDVNMGQSSNDVIPTAIHVSAALELEQRLMPALKHLARVLDRKAQEVGDVVKTSLSTDLGLRYTKELRFTYYPPEAGLGSHKDLDLLAPRLAVAFKYGITPDIVFTEDAEALPNIVVDSDDDTIDSAKLNINSTSKLSIKLTTALSFVNSLVFKYDSAPATGKPPPSAAGTTHERGAAL